MLSPKILCWGTIVIGSLLCESPLSNVWRLRMLSHVATMKLQHAVSVVVAVVLTARQSSLSPIGPQVLQLSPGSPLGSLGGADDRLGL